MVRFIALVLLLSACSALPQKSLGPGTDLGKFETAFVETGNDYTARSVVHIVSTGDRFGLVIYVRRNDGQTVRLSRARQGKKALPLEWVILAENVVGGLIPLTSEDLAMGASRGISYVVCSALDCYPVKVPAELYQQALLE